MFSSPEAYVKSVEPNRQRLKKILGMVDERKKFDDIEYVGGPKMPSLVAETEHYKVFAIRWPVFEGVDGEGLLLEPKDKIRAQVIAIPDAAWTPEMLVGLAPGVQRESQFPRWLAKNGCRVVVPLLIDRKDDWSGSARFNRWTNQPHREFIYRMAYEMGRHILGYEVQKVLAVVDWFTKDKNHPPVGVWGKGEGSVIAVLSAACDKRIQSDGAEPGRLAERATALSQSLGLRGRDRTGGGLRTHRSAAPALRGLAASSDRSSRRESWSRRRGPRGRREWAGRFVHDCPRFSRALGALTKMFEWAFRTQLELDARAAQQQVRTA